MSEKLLIPHFLIIPILKAYIISGLISGLDSFYAGKYGSHS